MEWGSYQGMNCWRWWDRSTWLNWDSFIAPVDSFEVWILLLEKKKWSPCMMRTSSKDSVSWVDHEYHWGNKWNVRGGHVWVLSNKGQTMIIQRLIQHLYPLEVGIADEESKDSADCTPDSVQRETPQGSTTDSDTRRRRRSVAVDARDKIIACFTDWESVERILFKRGGCCVFMVN